MLDRCRVEEVYLRYVRQVQGGGGVLTVWCRVEEVYLRYVRQVQGGGGVLTVC